MNFGEVVQAGFRKYFDFNTRSSRSEFWLFIIFLLITGSIVTVIEGQLFPGDTVPNAGLAFSFGADASNGPLSAIFSIIVFIPWLSASVRRLHDIGKSGWWVIVGFIPLIGWLMMLIWLVRSGDVDDNVYGCDPLGSTAGE